MLLYATGEDLTNWLGEDPDTDASIDPMLRKASILVGRACRNDLYDVDNAGKPSDPDLVEAMRDAVCTQVEQWVAAGYDVIAGPGGQAPRKTTVAVDGASYSTDAYLTNAARDEAMGALNADAIAILRNAGLASGLV